MRASCTCSRLSWATSRIALLVSFLFLGLAHRAASFQYQHDTLEDCESRAQECTTHETLWYLCPITCSGALQQEGGMAHVQDDPEAFFDLQAVKASTGKPMTLEDYEGYVTVVAQIPLLPGMGQFYLDVLEHIQSIFPYTIQVLVQPHQVDLPPGISKPTWKLETNSKLTLLQPTEAGKLSDVLNYLVNVDWNAGNPNTEVQEHLVTTFVVSSDGTFVERLYVPTMPLLERRIAVFLKQLDYRAEL